MTALAWAPTSVSKDGRAVFAGFADGVRAEARAVLADPTAVRQIVINLVGNALDAARTKVTVETVGTTVRVRRGPIGVMLALAPFNYPLNEMYAMLIPALLMGNTAVLKLPAIGGLAHVLSPSFDLT